MGVPSHELTLESGWATNRPAPPGCQKPGSVLLDVHSKVEFFLFRLWKSLAPKGSLPSWGLNKMGIDFETCLRSSQVVENTALFNHVSSKPGQDHNLACRCPVAVGLISPRGYAGEF